MQHFHIICTAASIPLEWLLPSSGTLHHSHTNYHMNDVPRKHPPEYPPLLALKTVILICFNSPSFIQVLAHLPPPVALICQTLLQTSYTNKTFLYPNHITQSQWRWRYHISLKHQPTPLAYSEKTQQKNIIWTNISFMTQSTNAPWTQNIFLDVKNSYRFQSLKVANIRWYLKVNKKTDLQLQFIVWWDWKLYSI